MTDSDIYSEVRPRREKKVRIRGVDYALSEWGEPDRPLVVWLHGWGDCGATCQFVVDRFDNDWHVVAPDFRGFGDSRSDAHAFWFPDYVADLDCLLDELSPGEPVFIVGHSMGGNVGGLYAGIRPERVRAFVNVEGFGLPDSDPADAPVRYRRWIEALKTEQRFTTYEDFDALAERVHKRNPRMAAAAARFVAERWAEQKDGRVELRASPQHRLPNPVLYRRAEAEACWKAVTAPVLLVAGGACDILTAIDPHAEGDSLALPFPGSVSEVVPNAGHMLHFEAPEALAALVERFLKRYL